MSRVSNTEQKAQSAEKVWSQAYDIIWPIIKKKKYKIGVEIGVAYGGHSERILQQTSAKLYSVDPYSHSSHYDDPMNSPQREFNMIYHYAKKRLSKYGKQSIFVRRTSEQASKVIKSQVDFVYIDADHSYQGVMNDIIRWYPKIKDGGIIAGHDYNHPNFPGVRIAVDQFFLRFGWHINSHKSGVWWLEKKPLNISYIMPAYNAENTIKASLNSIFSGNYRPGDEIIVVDDSSTDSTVEQIKQLSSSHPKTITLIKNKYNHGGGHTRNVAVENANNPLIFCLDSDNLLEKNSVPKLKDFLVSSTCDIASFETLQYFKGKPTNLKHKWKFSESIYDDKNYLSSNIVPGASGNYLFTKRSWFACRGYPTYSGALDTWGFGLRQVLNGFQMGVLKGSSYLHRLSSDSYWLRELSKNPPSIQALRIILEQPNRIQSRDLDRIMSKRIRYNWFNDLDTSPIHIVDDNSKSLCKKVITVVKKYLKV